LWAQSPPCIHELRDRAFNTLRKVKELKMHEPTSCNGWSNHETWLASLWLNNDEASHEVLLQAYQQGDGTYAHAEWLEQQLRDKLDEDSGDSDLWYDLLIYSFNHINWVEVIETNEV